MTSERWDPSPAEREWDRIQAQKAAVEAGGPTWADPEKSTRAKIWAGQGPYGDDEELRMDLVRYGFEVTGPGAEGGFQVRAPVNSPRFATLRAFHIRLTPNGPRHTTVRRRPT